MSAPFVYAQTEEPQQQEQDKKSKSDYTVKGVVKDAVSGQPVNGAVIHIANTSAATSTDEQGMFTLKSKNYFDYVIISRIGYADEKVLVIDRSQQLVVMLKAAASQLNDVAILGVKEPQSVTTLTDVDLNRGSGLNLQDAINNVPGVNMQSRSPWGGQHIIIRGYYPSTDNGRSNSENFGGLGYQLYLNNIPVTDATGTTVMDDIDYSNLGKVEIVKGPSPLYGSYIAGAVSLFTPKVEPNQTTLQEQAVGGSYGLFRTNTSIMTSDGKMDLWANYGHQTYDGFRPNDGSRKDFASFAANFYVSNKQTISAYFSYNHSYEQLAGEIDSTAFYGRKAVSDSNYVLNNSHVDIESMRGGLTDKYRFNDHFSMENTVFVTGYSLNQAFAHGYSKNEAINFGSRTAVSYDSHGDKVNVNGILGIAFQKSNENAQGNFILPFVLPPFNPTTAHMSFSDAQNAAMNYDIFTQWTFRLPKQQLSLTVGGSVNFVEFSTQNLVDSLTKVFINDPVYVKAFKPTFTPDVSLLKVFNRNISAYASVSMGYAPPTIAQMTESNGTIDVNLKPETAIQYEIGTKGNFGKDQKLSYQLALFDMDITNRLTSETANSITSYVNVGEQRNLGAELYASYSIINDKNKAISLLRPWISYTYMDAKYIDFKNHAKSSTGGDTVIANYSNNKVAAVAPNMFNAGVDVATKYGLYLFAKYQFMDKVAVTFDNSTSMKSYNLLNARIGYKRKFGRHFAGDIFVGADNILGSTYYNFIFTGQNIQELAQGNDPNVKGGGGDGYILPAPYNATFYGGLTFSYRF